MLFIIGLMLATPLGSSTVVSSVRGQGLVDAIGYVSAAALVVPYTVNPPDVSVGACRPDQWKDATIVKLNVFGDPQFVENATGYLMLEYDNEGLYGCIDLQSARSIEAGTFQYLFFDTGHDGMTYDKFQRDDVETAVKVENVVSHQVGLIPFTITGTPLGKVIITGYIDHSPNIVCDMSGNS
jgi:hypothetical protein